MKEITDGLVDGVFKDAPPLKTVERIKNILRQYDIETEEHWNESSVPYCYSIRVTIRGTAFGVNGKGLTREFALASGYGELMERLQLGYVSGGNSAQKSGDLSQGDRQSDKVSGEMLLTRNRQWYEQYARIIQKITGSTVTADAIVNRYADSEGNVMATPYYCLTKKSWEYLPTALRKKVYTANGCAAGNTMEEAVVQAISEIVERQFKMRALSEKKSFPTIPEEKLRSCKVAYEIISFLRQNGFQVVVKDVSFGTKFPVICVYLIDKKTGRYHTHFGAYPVFEIALERTLTESFQGRNIAGIASFEDFYYQEQKLYSIPFLKKELVKGTAEKMPQFFLDDDSEVFSDNVGFTGKNNRELFCECLAFIKEQGYDVLLRDCSCLGFPTYQVIVPGYSEVFPNRLVEAYDDTKYNEYVTNALRDPVSASFEDMLGFLMKQSDKSDFSSPTDGFVSESWIPVVLPPQQDRYYLDGAIACICYAMGRYDEAILYITNMIRSKEEKELPYLICLKRYLSLKQNRYEEHEIRSILTHFHGEELVQSLYQILNENGNPLQRVVVRCDMQCRGDCRLQDVCLKKQSQRLQDLIIGKYAEIDQKALEKLVQEI